MTPAAIIDGLARGTTLVPEAAAALRGLLDRIARGPLHEPTRPGETYWIENPDEQRELAAQVFVKVVEKRLEGGWSLVGKPDGVCYRYLQTMIVRAFIDELRRRAKVAGDDGARLKRAGNEGSPWGEDPQSQVAHYRALLARAFADALAARRPEHRADLGRAWGHAQELAFDGVTLRELVERDEGIGAAAPVAEREAAGDRLLQAQCRLRKAMNEAISEARATGRLTGEEADDAALAMRMILRRRPGPGGARRR